MKRMLSIATLALLISVSIAYAATHCPTNEHLTIGSPVSGSVADLCVCDGTNYVLSEGLDNGKSKLRVYWEFPSVPAGTISLHFKGTRPANSEGDNFQFYYTTTGSPFGILIPGAIINKPFAPTEGVTIVLETTTSVKNFRVFLSDTNNSGPILDTVSLDCVQIINN